jgi:O-antigen biosynthesis protein
MVKCSICKLNFDAIENLENHLVDQHKVNFRSKNMLHYLAKMEERIQTLEESVRYVSGRCNICGSKTIFSYHDNDKYRNSLRCNECFTLSRYRSIARGILKAIKDLRGIESESVRDLINSYSTLPPSERLSVYDTQVPFYYRSSYPIPDILSECKWIDVQTSIFKPQEKLGAKVGPNTTNQNLERLTFFDDSFDIVITSDVMEHVRLDDQAHQEIRRVLKPGGVYLFTVPHGRISPEGIVRVAVTDPSDPSKDQFLLEKEYHGDANSPENRSLSYRVYGTNLDRYLERLGFTVEYSKKDFPETAIMNTELFYCKLSK